MSEQSQVSTGCSDAKADAIAVVALITIVIVTVVYWLASQ